MSYFLSAPHIALYITGNGKEIKICTIVELFKQQNNTYALYKNGDNRYRL